MILVAELINRFSISQSGVQISTIPVEEIPSTYENRKDGHLTHEEFLKRLMPVFQHQAA